MKKASEWEREWKPDRTFHNCKALKSGDKNFVQFRTVVPRILRLHICDSVGQEAKKSALAWKGYSLQKNPMKKVLVF